MIPRNSSDAVLFFPIKGIDLLAPFQVQAPQTTPIGENVRSFDTDGRSRGGSRPGLQKYIAGKIGSATWLTQDLNSITTMGTPSVSQQSSSSGRIVYLTAVSVGSVYYSSAGATAWTAATNNSGSSPAMNAAGIIRSAPNGLKLFFVDGNNYRYFDTSTLAVEAWTATDGTLPVDGSGNKARLICTWRGRTVLSGVLEDPQNWFMSKLNDPFNFDYSPASVSPADAIAGNNAPQGLIGDVITGLCPYSDDVLIFFGDHSIYMMRGDPLAGGAIDLVSDVIGGTWGIPWCKDPFGAVYFFSNLCGIYSLIPGQLPVRISGPIDNLIRDVDTGLTTVRLVWDDRYQGLHVFMTPTANAVAGEDAFHLFWEQRTNSWWKDTFSNYRHNPLTVLNYDGNLPTDRVTLLGGWDGYVRSFSNSNSTDDGHTIYSRVMIGPVLSATIDDMMLAEVQAVLGEASGDVTFKIYIGRTAEAALASQPVYEGTWSLSRNMTTAVRRAAPAVYIELSSTDQWAMESIRVIVEGKGSIRKRAYIPASE